MDPRLLKHYNSELQHIRDMAAEFATEFPKIAGRLGIDGTRIADPYVERLLEGFSFLTARIQLRMDAEFPNFTQHMLEIIYPHYLAPTPSMCVVQFQPDLTEGSLESGVVLPRGTALRSLIGKDDQTACEFRTAHEVTLWPLEIEGAEYFNRNEAKLDLPDLPGVKAGIRFRFRATAGLTFDKLSLDHLPIYLCGQDQERFRIYEHLLGSAVAVVVRPPDRQNGSSTILGASSVRQVGFEKEQSLLPQSPQSFEGYRVLHEYFAFPDRFLFVDLANLSDAIARCKGDRLEIMVLFGRADRMLEKVVEPTDFALFCAPAINLFPKRADRIQLSDSTEEYHVVPDRSRPVDFEVYSVTNTVGIGEGGGAGRVFSPFYGMTDLNQSAEQQAFYATRRLPRILSSKERRTGDRSGYVGSELYLSLVDGREGPFAGDLRQMAVETLCTNRDLPLHMPVGRANTDFTLQISAPVKSIRILNGPTRPKPSPTIHSGELSWRLINHLSLNYLSLVDHAAEEGAVALRELLSLYAEMSEPANMKQVDGVRSVSSTPVVRRIPGPGPTTYARGLEVSLLMDDAAFEGSCAFLLGAVLNEFFTRYVSLNSFTELVVRTVDRGEIGRWPAKIGRRHRL